MGESLEQVIYMDNDWDLTSALLTRRCIIFVTLVESGTMPEDNLTVAMQINRKWYKDNPGSKEALQKSLTTFFLKEGMKWATDWSKE